MESILKKASELGLMIQQTEVYAHFEKMSRELVNDNSAKMLLDEYSEFAREIQSRMNAGDIIEVFEKERLEELQEQVRDSEILRSFIEARDRYVDFLMQIQKAIEGDNPGE